MKKYRESRILIDALVNLSEPMSGTPMEHLTRKKTTFEPVWKYHLMLMNRSQFRLLPRKFNELDV